MRYMREEKLIIHDDARGEKNWVSRFLYSSTVYIIILFRMNIFHNLDLVAAIRIRSSNTES